MPRQTPALAFVAFATFAASALFARDAAPNHDATLFLGATVVNVLEQPTKIEVWRITDAAKDRGPAPRAVDLALAKELAAILLDEKTYSFDTAKKCEFQAGVGIRVWGDERKFDVILCFHCHELQIVTPDARSKKFPSNTEDFDNARPALTKLVKQAFPDDKEIQALK